MYTDINRIDIINTSHAKINPMYSDERILNRFVFDTLTFSLATKYLATYMGQSPRFDTIIAENQLLYRSQQDFSTPLKFEIIDSFCHKNNCDALLAVEATIIKDSVFKYHGSFMNYILNDDVGIQNSIIIRQVLITRSRWSFYQPQRPKMKISWVQTDTLFYNITNNILDFDEILADPQSVEYLANDLAIEIAGKLSRQIAPYWVSVDRKYFRTMNNDFINASDQMVRNNWLQTIQLLKKYEYNPDIKLSAAACYNIAVACEAMGKTDIAIDWLEKSIQKYPLQGAENYREVLKQRQIENVRLDLQFGIKK
jgi:hypothetical protein